MKAKINFFVQFILLILLSTFILAQDSCPAGMRKTYVDDVSMIPYGSARAWYAAVCYFQWPGALFFKRKVLIEPRFEVHLKAALEKVDTVETSDEQKVYGFTIVISGYKNTISGYVSRSQHTSVFDDIGYNNYVNSLIIEFDFQRDKNDPDDNSFSIRFCDKSCTADDYYSMYKAKLSNQQYNYLMNNNWDFRLIYANRQIQLLSGASQLIYSKAMSLEELLGTNIGFVGFTGFTFSNRREINLLGSFICEDNYEISLMPGNFYINEKKYETATYQAGTDINYIFSFINNKNQLVPHTYGYDIWNYTFGIISDCGKATYLMTKETNYTLILNTKACTKVGKHPINILENKKGNAPLRYYNVIAGPMKKIVLIGHDGIIGPIRNQTISSTIILTYGDAATGDFIYKKGLKLILDFSITDEYGNPVDVPNPNTLFNLKKVSTKGEISAVTSNIISYTMKKLTSHYQMTLLVNKIGTYQIENTNYMQQFIRFSVIPGEADPNQSYCTLEGYTAPPTIEKGKTVLYNCYLKDSIGNDIPIEIFLQKSAYVFYCATQRTSFNSNANFTNKVNDKGTYYSCEVPATDSGSYVVNGYLLAKANSKSLRINSKINQFTVKGDGSDLSLKNVYNLYNKKWLDINGAVITFSNEKTSLITVVDLVEEDGKTLLSSYGKYPDYFDIKWLTAIFYSEHDLTYKFAEIVPKFIEINGREYIGIYTKDGKNADTLVKKSSFDYKIRFTLQKGKGFEEKVVTLKYIINISPYTTCFHDLSIKNTNLDMGWALEFVTGADERKIAKVELKTTDFYLYNYDIGKENVQFLLEPSSTAIIFRVVPLSIEGTYDVYAKAKADYQGYLIVKIKGEQIRKIPIVAKQAEACYLDFEKPENFEYLYSQHTNHFYEYKGDFLDGNLYFRFKLKDKYNNSISKEDYLENFADVYSIPFGNADYTNLNITYNATDGYYYFRDRLPFQDRQFTWVLFLRDASCNTKIHITYDGMRRGNNPVSLDLSRYNLLQNQIKNGEYGYVDVIYKDINGQLLGLQPGKLEEIKAVTVVSGKTSDGKSVTFVFDSITSAYVIKYKYQFKNAGVYKVTATSNGTALKCGTNDTLVVLDMTYSLKHSKMQLVLDTIIDMSVDVRYTIDNTVQRPFYNLLFYTKDGLKTNYDPKTNFKCQMKGQGVTLDLNVDKTNKDFVKFTHKDSDMEQFKALKGGDYKLLVSDDKETVEYQLYLKGDGENDYSNEKDYDLSKTEVNPTHIDGIAGRVYTINVEFRAKDGLRWNYLVDLTKFSVSNSYGLSGDKFTYKLEHGYKKGQVVIYVNQTVVTTEKFNILTLTYNNEKIPKTVSLNIKCAEFARLIYVNGPTKGNVINPPILTFKPVDRFGNLCTDIFNSSSTQEYLDSLTIGKSFDGVPLTTHNYLEEGQYLKVQYLSKISTNARVTSLYFTEHYDYRIRSGPIDPETSYAQLTKKSPSPGTESNIIIYPKDLYLNDIDDLGEKDMNEFLTYYQVNDNGQNNVTKCKLVEDPNKSGKTSTAETIYKTIECTTTIIKTGEIEFHVDYLKDEIECRSCEFTLTSNEIDFSKIKTLYKNKEIYLKTDIKNEIEAKKEPVFEMTFFDKYENQMGAQIVGKLNISTTLGGIDIKLCVSNSGEKKVASLCPATNGDDNLNKWQYVTNGDNYTLKVQDKDISSNKVIYPLKITGGSEGSSEEEDLSKTNFDPTNITIKAGEEGKTTMELRTAKGVRKNYWYPNPSEKIKVDFAQDKENCTYKVEKGELPGQYSIKVSCTKANDANGFTVTVDGKKIDQKITLIVLSNRAYYLEVVDVEKFKVSSDKYTWKVNPSNDDVIDFTFKLKDKYLNYIKTSVIGKNEITIDSEKYGANNLYYKIEWNGNKITYLFTDNITEPITKHVWNIVCLESNKKYSFIYTRVPGAVDVSKSYWTIDKTAYIIKETSTVLVTLVDKLGVLIGTQAGRLDKEKDKVSVVTNKDKDLLYVYNSNTNDFKLKYNYDYKEIGKYKVSVTYDKKQIGEKKDVTVSYQKVDLKTSKLFYDIGDNKENFMQTTVQTNIENQKYTPFYKFYLYTADGEKITLFDKSKKVTCFMTIDDNSWELNVDLNKGDYIHFSYKDGDPVFNKLPFGLYSLDITYDGELIKYPVFLLGEKDVSPSSSYDLSKTLVDPTYIDGIAGKQYEIFIEFRAKDGLRWNYEVNLNALEIANSYGLNTSKLNITKQLGEKNGQAKLLVTQYVASSGKDNVLTLSYATKEIPQKVTLHIKHSNSLKLVYVGGAVDGTVVNPSIVKFTPKDEYDNLYTDLFDNTKWPKAKLEQLTKAISVEGHNLTTNNWVSDNLYLNVQYGCTKVTTIKLTPEYNGNTYKYKLWSGPIDPDHSYAEVVKTDNVRAGDITTVKVYPKDLYGNNVTNVTVEDLSKFDVDYEINKENKTDISKQCDITKLTDHFICKTNITKAGDAEFTVDYDDKSVKCKKCQFPIHPDVIDFYKTRVFDKNEDKEMSRTELNVLPVSILPNFELFFFDRFMNAVTNKTEVAELKVATEIQVTDVKLCVSTKVLTKLSNVCKSQNKDENEKKWQYLPNGDKYKLYATQTDKNKTISFPVKLTGGFNDGDPGPVDANKTFINPTELTLVAGEEKPVFLELRTKDEKRKNYWYEKPEDNISVKFPEDVKKCTYSLAQNEKPGQYDIKFVCTEKKDPFNVTVFVEGKEVPQKVTLTVVPAGPAKSRLFRMTGEEIKVSDLGKVSVEDKFQMINRLYDKYDNLITNINFPLSSLEIKMAPSNSSVVGHKYAADLASQTNGDIIITLTSTYAGEHVVTGLYFPLEKYTILFTHGEPDADNSIVDVSHTERYVGEEVKVYITPYDKYNNYIDAMEYKDVSPYQVKYSNEVQTEKKVMTIKYSIEKKDGLNVLSYPGAFFIKGITTVYGFIDTKQVHCRSCRINIKSKDISFADTNVLRLEQAKNIFETLKNGTVERNTKEEPVYRLYPRDQYLNDIDLIPEEQLKLYKAYFKSQNSSVVYNLKLNNKELKNQAFAEFVINDVPGETVTWKTLVGGYYDLVFTDGKVKLTYNITLEGDGKGGSNEPADFQHTHINDQNLKYIAGKFGYMLIEIRTKDNVRKNFWDGFKFKIESCDKDDKTFNFTQENAGMLGVFYITVTTQKANTYPKLIKCPLKVYVNDELVKDMNPEMEVSPDEVVRTKILEKYYKDGKNSSVLLDGNADIPYVFEVASYDQYGNLAETLQEVVGIQVALRGGDVVNKTTSETNTTTGFRKYTVPATKAGVYVVYTEKSGPQGLYLPNESIFTIHPGKIDLSKTIVKEKDTPIPAGSHPAVSIEAFDKHDNPLYVEDYIDKFNATFIDAGNKEHASKPKYDEVFQKVFYTSVTPVTIVGNVRVTVVYDKKDKIDTSKVIIVVIAGDPDPMNSILSREITKGIFTQYKNGDSFTVDTNEVLLLNVTLYDKYHNYIANIPADANVLDPVMFGNQMDEIAFTVTKNPGYFGLDFNENATYVHIYQHLVGGTYNFTYKVKTALGEAPFKYNIIVNKDDKDHGNGPYDLSKCILKPKNTSFVAGNYEKFTLELRTKENLLYNDDIDISKDIDIKIDKQDKSFKSTVEKAGSEYGIYTITIYSEKKGKYVMDVLLADPAKDKKEKGNVGPAYYTVFPCKVPDKRYTVITVQPEKEVNVDDPLEFRFTLADKFDNLFEGRHDCVDEPYLSLISNEEPLPVKNLTLLPDEKTYVIYAYPKYPPRNMSINVLYNDGDDSVYCFPENINITIRVEIDYLQTQIVSSNKELIHVGEVLDMWLYTFDKKGECFNEDYSKQFKIHVTGPLNNTKLFNKTYSVRKIDHPEKECNNEYQIITTEADIYKIAGNYIIRVTGNDTLIAKYDQVCLPLGYEEFLLYYEFDPDHISILDNVQFSVSGEDRYGNKLEEPLHDDMTINFTQNDTYTPFESSKIEKKVGNLTFDVGIRKVGPHQLHLYYKGKEVLTVNHGEKLPIFTIEPGPCRAETNEHFDLTPTENAEINVKTYFSFQCYDIYGNKITKGGEKFTPYGKLVLETVDNIPVETEIIDNNDGTYNVEFVPEMHGTYVFDLVVDKEKYGEPVKVEITKKICTGSTSILCPNVNKCVEKIQDCIVPPNDCPIEKPFKCKVNGTEQCTKSQVDCDCPPGFIRCSIMKYCVPEDRPDMCPAFKKNKALCSKYGDNYKMFYDGICRPEDYHGPNQRVCPIGQVLCADLSCRDTYYDCVVTEFRDNNKVRCLGQAIVSIDSQCPSSYTCNNEEDVACPDGTCVSNEIFCSALPKCPEETIYRCQNNQCATEYSQCSQSVSCGHMLSLCSDNICRETCDA